MLIKTITNDPNTNTNNMWSSSTIINVDSTVECMSVVDQREVVQENLVLKHYKTLGNYDSYLVVGLESGDIHVYQNNREY